MIAESNKSKVILKDYSKNRHLPETPVWVYAFMVNYNYQPMYAIPCGEVEKLPTIPSYLHRGGDYHLVNIEHIFTPEEASILLAERNHHEQIKETKTMKQLYVAITGKVLVGGDFSYDEWYPVTINPSELTGYVVDNEGGLYLLDLYRLHNNPAWISRTVDVSLPLPLSDNF